jgi:Ca-activated chloride channel family protein
MRALILATALATALAPVAQARCATDAMLVFDGSASMADLGFDPTNPTRIDDARAAVARALPDVEPFRRIGLMTYGPGGVDGCSGLTVHFGPTEMAADPIIERLDALEPDGQTPLASAVVTAAELMAFRAEPTIIVLVTDGDETCGGRVCTLASQLAASARDLTIHVIGFRGEASSFAWNNPDVPRFPSETVARCLADRTGGLFVATETVTQLVRALQRTLGCAQISAAPALGRRPTA